MQDAWIYCFNWFLLCFGVGRCSPPRKAERVSVGALAVDGRATASTVSATSSITWWFDALIVGVEVAGVLSPSLMLVFC